MQRNYTQNGLNGNLWALAIETILNNTVIYFNIVLKNIKTFSGMPVSRQIVRLQQTVCLCMILEVSTE